MKVNIVEYQGTAEEDAGVASLLARVYVKGGFTDASIAEKVFAPAEVKRRGMTLIATNLGGNLVGMIICGTQSNPYRQVATSDEAEMQLLAVDPSARGQGLGRSLCLAFERKASSLGYGKVVLSTQPTMHAAHRVYEELGYRRNSARDWEKEGRSFLVYEKSLGHIEPASG